MSTNSFGEAPATRPDRAAPPTARVALQIVGIIAIFAAAYLTTSTLLTNGYDATTTAVRLGLAAVAAAIAAGALVSSRRIGGDGRRN